MFTGIIEQVGRLMRLESRGTGARLVIGHSAWPDAIVSGESVAVQGVCLTATTVAPGEIAFDVLRETLERTSLGDKRPGSRVNLERAMRADGRFGGHLVSGHVDGTGTVAGLSEAGSDWVLDVTCPVERAAEIVLKGSVAVDGISLTVAAVRETGFAVHLIPFTMAHTSAGELRAGDRVNLETDMVGKYVRQWLERTRQAPAGIALDDLKRAGFA